MQLHEVNDDLTEFLPKTGTKTDVNYEDGTVNHAMHIKQKH